MSEATAAGTDRPEVIGIAAVARNGVIGAGNDIPWRLPEDWARFKALTTGHVLIMGRKTYDSIGRPLPGRTTVVVTRGGLSRPVGDVAWMRVREVWLHLIDLAVGFGPAGLPVDVSVAVADDVLRTYARRTDVPPFAVEVLDTGTRFDVGVGGPLVVADAPTLVGWLTGPHAGMVTGAAYTMDGGWSAR